MTNTNDAETSESPLENGCTPIVQQNFRKIEEVKLRQGVLVFPFF